MRKTAQLFLLLFAVAFAHAQASVPTISKISPSLSPAGPVGRPVTITGTNFGASGTVAFGGVTATTNSWSATSIVANVPAGLADGSTTVTVSVGGVASNAFAFKIIPVITTASANYVPTGTVITVTGVGFGAAPGTITFNGVPTTPAAWSDSSVTAAVPVDASNGPLVITAIGGFKTNGLWFYVTPHIDSISPAANVIGAPVTITGTGFGTSFQQFITAITFNGISATPTSWGNTSIVVPVPAGASSGSVIVYNNFASNSVPFTVATSAPTLQVLSPTSGSYGTTVTISGAGFGTSQGSGFVMLGTARANVTSWSDTQITATVALNAASGPAFVSQGAPSNSINFTVPVTVQANPASVTLATGMFKLVNLTSNAGTPVTADNWTSDNTSVATIITQLPVLGSGRLFGDLLIPTPQTPEITAVAPGTAHLTATYQGVTAKITVTVVAPSDPNNPSLPPGTVEWTIPPQYSGGTLIRSLETAPGQPAYFMNTPAGDGLIALDNEGRQLWATSLDSASRGFEKILPDMEGDVITQFANASVGDALLATASDGSHPWTYNAPPTGQFDIHPGHTCLLGVGCGDFTKSYAVDDGKVYVVESAVISQQHVSSLVSINTATGQATKVTLPASSITNKFLQSSCGGTDTITFSDAFGDYSQPTVMADGTVYIEASTENSTDTLNACVDPPVETFTGKSLVQLLHYDSTGALLSTQTLDGTPGAALAQPRQIIPDGQGGVIATWTEGGPNPMMAHITSSGSNNFNFTTFGDWKGPMVLGDNNTVFSNDASINVGSGTINWSNANINHPLLAMANGALYFQGNDAGIYQSDAHGNSTLLFTPNASVDYFPGSHDLLAQTGALAGPQMFASLNPSWAFPRAYYKETIIPAKLCSGAAADIKSGICQPGPNPIGSQITYNGDRDWQLCGGAGPDPMFTGQRPFGYQRCAQYSMGDNTGKVIKKKGITTYEDVQAVKLVQDGQDRTADLGKQIGQTDKTKRFDTLSTYMFWDEYAMRDTSKLNIPPFNTDYILRQVIYGVDDVQLQINCYREVAGTPGDDGSFPPYTVYVLNITSAPTTNCATADYTNALTGPK